MRQIFLEKGAIAVKEVCQPLLDDYGVLVSVHYSCVSAGTESATIANAAKNPFFNNVSSKIKKLLASLAKNGVQGTKALIKARLAGNVQALGYSCSGRVIAIGKKVHRLKVGDYVACAGAGMASHADIVVVPENLVVLVRNEKILKAASMTTIGSIALQGLRRADVKLGETVCVIGLGLLGQLTVQLANLSGCRVIGIDIMQERLDIAKRLGADEVYHAEQDDIEKMVMLSTKYHGVDCTLITAASSSDKLVQQAMAVTRKKGSVVVVGDVGLNLKRDPFYKKEIDFLISCSYGPGRYDVEYEQQGADYPYAYVRWTENRNMQAFVRLLEQDKIAVKILSQEVPLENAAEGYELVKKKKTFSTIISYVPKKDEQYKPAQKLEIPEEGIRFTQAARSTLRVGLVGVGGFAQAKLIPLVSKIGAVKISAVVDSNITAAINTSRLYGASKVLLRDNELFSENIVDVVVIASPHKFHCDQALRALSNGMAVFVEKPMATNFEQFARLSSFLRSYPKAPFCVDYNRSFAPFIQKIKKEIVKRKTPLAIHYRMNAGLILKDHWIQTDIGAGRIIGEACHIVDLFCSLTEAEPVSVSVETVRPANENVFPTDNFSVQISFSDGSVCTLLYTALGHGDLGKERMEIFYDSKAIVMDDYLTLKGYGLPVSFNAQVLMPDKGHGVLVKRFFDSIQNDQVAPISFDRLNTVAELTLMIDQLACQGGGAHDFT